jgi:rhodanese-related sulfurtransferase
MKKILLIVVGMAIAASALSASYPDITRDALKQAIAAKDVVLIDVNGTESYRKGHIPGAIDYVAVEKDLAAQLPENKGALIVAYCGSPQCGAYARAADAARKLGYTNVRHYSDGISGWKAANEPVDKVP